MKTTLTSGIGWLLLLSILGFYGYGIFDAVWLSWPKTDSIKPIEFSDVLSTTLSSIQALMLTNLGMLLGISVSNRNSAVARRLLLHSPSAADQPEDNSPTSLRESIQLFALAIYVLVLIVCLVTWIHKDFSTENSKVVPIVAESGKTFIGVALAYLAAIIGK